MWSQAQSRLNPGLCSTGTMFFASQPHFSTTLDEILSEAALTVPAPSLPAGLSALLQMGNSRPTASRMGCHPPYHLPAEWWVQVPPENQGALAGKRRR